MLSTDNHDRDVVGKIYVYPVISRRAGGVSLGINLNPNNACNWQCVYCQVPDLKRGVAPKADLLLLEQELDAFLQEVLHGDFMVKHVPEHCRVLQDIAISGNGEPTTCPNFSDVVALIVRLMQQYSLVIPLRLISNGSSVHKLDVQRGLQLMAEHRGEVWFKVDAIGEAETQAINGVSLSADWQQKQLELCSRACPTWLQTCIIDQQDKQDVYAHHYLTWLESIVKQSVPLQGVLLYGLARPSMQEGGEMLASVHDDWMQNFAKQIESLGLSVTVS